jgi:hypothetical protein
MAASTLAFGQQPAKTSKATTNGDLSVPQSGGGMGGGFGGGGWSGANPQQVQIPEYSYAFEIVLGKKSYSIKLNSKDGSYATVLQSFENGKLFVHVFVVSSTRVNGPTELNYTIQVGRSLANPPKGIVAMQPSPNEGTMLYASGQVNVAIGKKKLVCEGSSTDGKSPKRKVFVTVSPIKSPK